MIAATWGGRVIRNTMEFSAHEIGVMNEIFGQQGLKRLTIRASFARGYLAVSEDVDMVMEFYYPSDFGAVLASMKFALKGILKLKIDVVTANDVERSLCIFVNGKRVLIFEE